MKRLLFYTALWLFGVGLYAAYGWIAGVQVPSLEAASLFSRALLTSTVVTFFAFVFDVYDDLFTK